MYIFWMAMYSVQCMFLCCSKTKYCCWHCCIATTSFVIMVCVQSYRRLCLNLHTILSYISTYNFRSIDTIYLFVTMLYRLFFGSSNEVFWNVSVLVVNTAFFLCFHLSIFPILKIVSEKIVNVRKRGIIKLYSTFNCAELIVSNERKYFSLCSQLNASIYEWDTSIKTTKLTKGKIWIAFYTKNKI